MVLTPDLRLVRLLPVPQCGLGEMLKWMTTLSSRRQPQGHGGIY
jgi:hypothetical protein